MYFNVYASTHNLFIHPTPPTNQPITHFFPAPPLCRHLSSPSAEFSSISISRSPFTASRAYWHTMSPSWISFPNTPAPLSPTPLDTFPSLHFPLPSCNLMTLPTHSPYPIFGSTSLIHVPHSNNLGVQLPPHIFTISLSFSLYLSVLSPTEAAICLC